MRNVDYFLDRVNVVSPPPPPPPPSSFVLISVWNLSTKIAHGRAVAFLINRRRVSFKPGDGESGVINYVLLPLYSFFQSLHAGMNATRL